MLPEVGHPSQVHTSMIGSIFLSGLWKGIKAEQGGRGCPLPAQGHMYPRTLSGVRPSLGFQLKAAWAIGQKEPRGAGRRLGSGPEGFTGVEGRKADGERLRDASTPHPLPLLGGDQDCPGTILPWCE